jgi:hypothetical protein
MLQLNHQVIGRSFAKYKESDTCVSEIVSYKEAVLKIKHAILQSRYRATANANAELLALYYGVGRYVSANTRSGEWGIGAIESISAQLQGEMPRLRGFSPSNMKNMRLFYEQWEPEFESNRQLPTADLETDKLAAFFRVGFTHHMEILRKCRSQKERWYYIFRTAIMFVSASEISEQFSYVPLKSGPSQMMRPGQKAKVV